MFFFWLLFGLLLGIVLISLGWRWASRRMSLPCPSLLAWMLDGSVIQRFNGTLTTLERLGLKPGEQILEIGPGPGRLLIPAAQRVSPEGKAVGIDIQPGMLKRLERRVREADVPNLTMILGDATQPHVPAATFDLVFLCTVLGEIPDRPAALAQCYRALKPGGRLSITEMAGDPHYQSRSTVRRLAGGAGFHFATMQGHWWFFTATFEKPA